MCPCEEITKQALCEQHGSLFHLGAGELSLKREQRVVGLSLVLIGFGIGGGVRSNVFGGRGWISQSTFSRVGRVIKKLLKGGGDYKEY